MESEKQPSELQASSQQTGLSLQNRLLAYAVKNQPRQQILRFSPTTTQNITARRMGCTDPNVFSNRAMMCLVK